MLVYIRRYAPYYVLSVLSELLAQGPGVLTTDTERLLLSQEKTPGFLASGEEELNPGPEMRLDHSELLCNKVLLKYKGD